MQIERHSDEERNRPSMKHITLMRVFFSPFSALKSGSPEESFKTQYTEAVNVLRNAAYHQSASGENLKKYSELWAAKDHICELSDIMEGPIDENGKYLGAHTVIRLELVHGTHDYVTIALLAQIACYLGFSMNIEELATIEVVA